MGGRFNRRRFFRRLAAGAAGTGGGLGGLYYHSAHVETEDLRVESVQIPIAGLPTALEGLRIAFLSDFHLFPHTRIELIERAVEAANRAKPDLALLGGDYVLRTADSIFELAPVLARLNPTHGVFSILGNHDHWRGADTIEQGLRESGLPLLKNQGLTIPVGGSRLFLAGVDDGWVQRHDLARSMEGLPSGVPVIVLMHEPDFADSFSADPRIALQVSGHSHGGQVRFPLIGSPFLPPYGRKYDKGLYRVGSMWLYTNVGLGVTAPVRFNCPPEVTVITLTAGPPSDVEGAANRRRPHPPPPSETDSHSDPEASPRS